MPRFDFKCPICEKVTEKFLTLADANKQQYCPECSGRLPVGLEKLPPNINFTIKGFSAKNGYSRG